MYSHLHTHSCYSFLEGLPSPAGLARAAGANRSPALALTDHLHLTGALAFYRACQEAGIKPILGLEVDLQNPYQRPKDPYAPRSGVLVLLAETYAGWQSLCRLSSALLSAPDEAGSLCTIASLSGYAKDVICLTGGDRGLPQKIFQYSGSDRRLPDLLARLAEIFPDRLYLELNEQIPADRSMNDQLVHIAKTAGIPIAAAHSVYYLKPQQASLQRTVSAIRTISPLAGLAAGHAAPPGAHFPSAGEMQQRFTSFSEALAMTEEIVSRCNLALPLRQPNFPAIALPPGKSAVDVLREKAELGARKLYGPVTAAVTVRLNQELAVIAERGYAPIFLIAEGMIAFTRQHDIPSASRGSASSSLVAHCIGITTPDPLSLDLYFERFLNPARTTPPDIDTDFCSRRRDEVIQYLFATYGADHVAMVGTINTFGPRSALAETAKAHGLEAEDIRALSSGLHHRYFRPQPEEENDNSHDPFARLLAEHKGNAPVTTLLHEARALLGLPHHLSVHAGGLVIAPGPMVDYVPVARSGGKGMTITQFDLDDVQEMGLVKLDILGIRGLTVLGDVAHSIHSWQRKDYHSALNVLSSIPADDSDTAALICAGRTIGCFQIESPGMQATLKDIQARSIPDLMAALALYRPGPLKGGLRDAFVRRHNHLEAVTQIHPALSGLLQETYGVILYQEQVLRIAHELAGLSLAEADLLRRAMSHFDPGKQMKALQEKFVAGVVDRCAIPPETGARIWEMMAAFAGYGFPKAHAASYAEVAWRSAWCKAHYPAEFIAAVLANWGGYYPQSVYLNEARRLGFSVRPPHINHALSQFSVSYSSMQPVLYMGLDQVRDLTHRTQANIQRLRPFTSLDDFLTRADPRPAEVDNLIRVGALAGLGAIPDLLRELSGAGRPRAGQMALFSFSQPSGEDWTLPQKIEAQQRLLGASLEAHPLEVIAGKLAETRAITTIEAASRVGQKVRVAGMRQTMRRSLTSQKEWMGFLTFEDLEGMLGVVLFPDVYHRARALLSGPAVPLVIEGTVERDAASGEPQLRAERVWRID